MLFYLTDSLIETDRDSAEFNDLYNACRNLAEASYHRRHLLMGQWNVLVWLDELLEKDPVRMVIRNLITNFSTMSIPSGITEYVEITRGTPEGKRQEGNRTIYNLDYRRFEEATSLNKSRLVGEYLNDAKMYFEIGKWYSHKKGYSLNLDFDPVAGSGVNIAQVAAEQQRQKAIFACIVDTDQRYPGADYGSTCKGCELMTFTKPMEHYKRIDAHEVENIIPHNLIDSLGFSDNELKDFRSICAHLEPKEDLKYYDIKSGLSKHKKFSQDPQWVSYYERIYNANENMAGTPFQQKWDATREGILVFSGVGGILKKSVEWMQTHPDYMEFDFLPYQQTEWNAIGQLVINKCVCRNSESLIQ